MGDVRIARFTLLVRMLVLGDIVGARGELPHGMKRDLRVVRAGLDRQIPAGRGGNQLVAVEPRQIDERLRPL